MKRSTQKLHSTSKRETEQTFGDSRERSPAAREGDEVNQEACYPQDIRSWTGGGNTTAKTSYMLTLAHPHADNTAALL